MSTKWCHLNGEHAPHEWQGYGLWYLCPGHAQPEDEAPDLDSDVDHEQMTHSEGDDCLGGHYKPTTRAEREILDEDARLHPIVAHPKFMRSLINDVERLDEANTDLARNALSLSSSLGEKIERVTELEAEVERLRRNVGNVSVAGYDVHDEDLGDD